MIKSEVQSSTTTQFDTNGETVSCTREIQEPYRVETTPCGPCDGVIDQQLKPFTGSEPDLVGRCLDPRADRTQ